MNEEELRSLTGFSLEEAVCIRIWDIVAQCEKLMSQGDVRNAELLRKEGLEITQTYEQREPFLVITHQAYINDQK